MAVHTRYITRRRMICAVTVLLLIALLLPVAVLPVMAADGRATASSPTLDRELTPSQVLAQVLTTGGGEILSDAEAEWLDHEASAELTAALKVSYDGTVSREYVTLIPEDTFRAAVSSADAS